MWGDVNPATKGQLVSERFSEVIDFGNLTSGYRSWENQGGPYASVVKETFQATLQMKFEDTARELKGESERLRGVLNASKGVGCGGGGGGG